MGLGRRSSSGGFSIGASRNPKVTSRKVRFLQADRPWTATFVVRGRMSPTSRRSEVSDDWRSAKTQRQAGRSAGGDESSDSKVSQKSDPGNYVVRDGKKLQKCSSKDLSTKEFRDMNRKSHMQVRKRAKAIAEELGTRRAGLPAQLGNN